MSENIEKIFVKEEFSDFSLEMQEDIKDWLNFDKDKWSSRLILLEFYFLGENANSLEYKEIVSRAFGSGEFPGLIKAFKMDKWGIFGGKKGYQLDTQDFFNVGKENARNLPREIAKQGTLMQYSGKNIKFTPLGIDVAKFLYFKFLRENNITLSILTKLVSRESLDRETLEEIVSGNVTLDEIIRMYLFETHQGTGNTYQPTKFAVDLTDFLLEHPYLDSSSSDELRTHFLSLVNNILLTQIRETPLRRLLKKSTDIREIGTLANIEWIYELEIVYRRRDAFRTWFSGESNGAIESSENKKILAPVLLLRSGPGAGKSVWMLQNAVKVYFSNFNKDLIEKYSIPFLVQLGDFSVEQIEDSPHLTYQNRPILRLNDTAQVDKREYSEAFFQLLNLLSEKSNSLFWISTYLKLFGNPRVILFFDGWDELEEILKPFFKELILNALKKHNVSIQVIIATRYSDSVLESILQSVVGDTKSEKKTLEDRTVLELESPTQDQVKSYLKAVGLDALLQTDKLKEIETRFGQTLTPLDLWLLGLFPNFQALPANRAELYERWLKYEVIIEYQEKLLSQIPQTKSTLELDNLLKTATSVQRQGDHQLFTLVQFLDGPVPSITAKADKHDYALLKFLPKLVHNRMQNPRYFFNFDQIVKNNPLFARFIHPEFTKSMKRNFRLINPHYDSFLAALHCFNTYLLNQQFDFLNNIHVEHFFKEILNNRPERREFDQQHQISNTNILLRNQFDNIASFDDEKVGYPLNQAGPFVFKVSGKNFIDPHKDQVYSYYWQKLATSTTKVPREQYIPLFDKITESIDRKPNELRVLLTNVLAFQNKLLDESLTLSQIYDQIEIDTPHLIPILLYAFNLSETENLTIAQLQRLEQSQFMNHPWVKLWVYREIIRLEPQRILELTKYALGHTYRYLLKFCVINIIPPLATSIDDSLFELSLQLFSLIGKRKYRQILLFHWSSHYLTPSQLDGIEDLMKNLIREDGLDFDIAFLLLLHGRKSQHTFHFPGEKDISHAKIFNFLVIAFNSGFFTASDFAVWVRDLQASQVSFIGELIQQEKWDAFHHQDQLIKSSETFFPFMQLLLEDWWKRRTPYKRAEIEDYLDKIFSRFSTSMSYQEHETFNLDLFQITKFFENYVRLDADDKQFLFEKGIQFLLKLHDVETQFKIARSFDHTQISEFFNIFTKWVLDALPLVNIIDFIEKFRNLFSFENFLMQALSKYSDSEDLLATIRSFIEKNATQSIPSVAFNSKRKTHPHIPKQGDSISGIRDFGISSNEKLLFLLPEVEVLQILDYNLDISRNEELLSYVYNLALLGTQGSFQKIADLWDTHYVAVNATALEDPSFFIWCGIPYELLETIYDYLHDPIAQIFYLVCFAIHDRFKPAELNEKHSNFIKNNFVIYKLRQFRESDIQNAVKLFFQADWPLDDYEFLFYFFNADEDLIEHLFLKIRAGELKLSDLQKDTYYRGTTPKTLGTKRFDFFKYFVKYFPDPFERIIQEVMEFGDQDEKISVFNRILCINHPKAIGIATNLWADYPKLIKPLKDFTFPEIFEKLVNTNNFVHISRMVGNYFDAVHFHDLELSDLNNIEKQFLEIEIFIAQKQETGKLEHFSLKKFRDALRKIKYYRREIRAAKRKIKHQTCSLDQFIHRLNAINPNKQSWVIQDRYPYFLRKVETVESVSVKLRELRELMSHFNQNESEKTSPLLEEILKVLSDYETTKERLLQGNEYSPSQYIDAGDSEKKSTQFFNHSELNDLILKINQFKFKLSPSHFLQFLHKLKTPQEKLRSIFYSFNTLFRIGSGTLVSIEDVKQTYPKFKKHLMKLIPNIDYSNILRYFDLVFEECPPTYHRGLDDDPIWLDPTEKRELEVIKNIKHDILRKIQNTPIDILGLLRDFENIGDGEHFQQVVNLFHSSNQFEFLNGMPEFQELYSKVPDPNRKLLQTYVFYIILSQRELHQGHLTHDYDDDMDAGHIVDNLFQYFLFESIELGYFSKALRVLKELGRDDWYYLVKNIVLLQADPTVQERYGVQYGRDFSIEHFPLSPAIEETLLEEEKLRAGYLFYSKVYFNLLRAQLYSLEQFWNNFKFIHNESQD